MDCVVAVANVLGRNADGDESNVSENSPLSVSDVDDHGGAAAVDVSVVAFYSTTELDLETVMELESVEEVLWGHNSVLTDHDVHKRDFDVVECVVVDVVADVSPLRRRRHHRHPRRDNNHHNPSTLLSGDYHYHSDQGSHFQYQHHHYFHPQSHNHSS